MDRRLCLFISWLSIEYGSASCSLCITAAFGISLQSLGRGIHGLYCGSTRIEWMFFHLGHSWPIYKNVTLYSTEGWRKEGTRSGSHITDGSMETSWSIIYNNLDRDRRFPSTIWKAIVDTLGIKSKMSSSFHPQTDGQTERVNQTLECYLWNYCNYEQDNWEEMLPMAEYAYNNSLHSTFKMTPCFAKYC